MGKAKKAYLSSALWPGIVLGLLSVIPIVNYVNFFCCLWIIGGGFLAALVFKQETGDVKTGDGALCGLIAGLIGAVVQAVGVGILWYFFHETYLSSLYEIFSQAEFDAAMQDMMAQMVSNPIIMVSLTLVSGIILNSIFATLGGIIGSAILHKKNIDKSLPEPPDEGKIEE